MATLPFMARPRFKCEYQANEFASGLVGLLYIEENGYGPESYADLMHQYGSPVDELD